MTRAPLLAAALFAATVPAAAAASPDAAPAPEKKSFKASFIGEGGGYKPSDPATDDYLQGQLGAGAALPAKPAEEPAPKAPVAPAPRPVAAPVAAAPVAAAPAARPSPAPLPAPAEGRPAPARAAVAERAPAAPPAADARPAGRASLWNGLVKPLDMAASSAADADPAAAREASERDYETHILGMKADPSRPALGTAPGNPGVQAAAPAAAPVPAEANKVFVTLALDPREAGSLRDAVAGLGSAAGFSADPRFEMTAAPGGRTLLSGWIPASRLADALTRPGVKRLSVEPRARPNRAQETSSPYLVGLRLDDPARARAAVDSGVRALTDAAGFRLTRVVGLETGPDGRAVAVVAGELPISRLSRVMGMPQVAKILPAGADSPLPSAAPSAAASSPSAGGLAGFGRFVMARGAWLVVLTLLLALPSIRDPLGRAASVFNPYR